MTTGPEWDRVRRLDPEFHDACVRFADVPRKGGHLDPKVRAFVHIVVDAAVTHLHEPGVRQHVAAALAAGASKAEVMEVLECTATLSIHAMNVGIPVLLEVLEERGERTGPAPLDARQEALKADFTARRGYWNPTWDEMLEVAPDLFEAYTDFSSVPWNHGHLSPMVKELLYIAFDTSATHLYRVGLKLHIENALGYGATPQQIIEVMEIATLIGMQSVTLGAAFLDS
ncbi:carboxymuconolactone decarboxylase family protein [Cryptosporangium sp. NPDC051539]|uniref:carboxymuconolactone decarboxylase family protein n=1 Tax=Cryptosporangium sp. NPDC051539 TaxID=3363962 RepID=UPI0037ADFBF8